MDKGGFIAEVPPHRMLWESMAAHGTGSRVWIEDLTAKKSSSMISESYKDGLSAQIQP